MQIRLSINDVKRIVAQGEWIDDVGISKGVIPVAEAPAVLTQLRRNAPCSISGPVCLSWYLDVVRKYVQPMSDDTPCITLTMGN